MGRNISQKAEEKEPENSRQDRQCHFVTNMEIFVVIDWYFRIRASAPALFSPLPYLMCQYASVVIFPFFTPCCCRQLLPCCLRWPIL